MLTYIRHAGHMLPKNINKIVIEVSVEGIGI
jgi:hypothetical protein